MFWTEAQAEARRGFRAFADAEIRPHAERCDREESFPPDRVRRMAERGYLGALVPEAHGGAEMDMVTFGFLNEEIGAACSSARSLLTVHGMVCHAILRFGGEDLRARWLPELASGRKIGAFALTEPEVGSDARGVQTTAALDDGAWVLGGRKKWTSFGQVADLFLVLAATLDGPLAVLVEADREGLSRAPQRGLLGCRGSMLAELSLRGCRVPAAHALGKPGFGMAVVGAALDVGRYSVAWGCVGIARACLEASERYSRERHQFGQPLASHQLVQRMLADMITGVRASRLLCLQAGASKDAGDPATVVDTLVAKYHASTTAMRVASDAVQIHGANGCGAEYPVARYLRDAKTMEIVEGTSEMQQVLIARNAGVEVRW